MTIYNLYMNNAKPFTPYDLITVADSSNNEIVWRGTFFKLPPEYSHKQIQDFTINIEYNYRHAYVII